MNLMLDTIAMTLMNHLMHLLKMIPIGTTTIMNMEMTMILMIILNQKDMTNI